MAGFALALIQRSESGEGQVIDVALYESIFNLMEGIVPEYDGADLIRQPSGTTVTVIVPTNTYSCGDGKYVVIGGIGGSQSARGADLGCPGYVRGPTLSGARYV